MENLTKLKIQLPLQGIWRPQSRQLGVARPNGCHRPATAEAGVASMASAYCKVTADRKIAQQ